MIAWRSLALALALALSPAGARAAPEDAAAAAVAKGKALYAKRDYTAALVEFELAHRLRPHYASRCSAASCLEQLGRAVEAADHYWRCLREGAEGSPLEAEVHASIKRVEARITWLSLSERAAVLVDGVAAGEAPGRIAVNPGCHVLELRRGGATRTLAIHTVGGERLLLGEGPATLPALGRPPATLPDAPPPPPTPGRPRRRLKPTLFWTTVALTAGLVGASAALSAQTVERRSDYESRPTREAYESFTKARLATNILWGFAAAAAGTGAVLYFYTDFGGEGRGERRAMIGGRASF